MRQIYPILAILALAACDESPSSDGPGPPAELGGAALEGRRSFETLKQVGSISPPSPGEVFGVKTDGNSVLLHQREMLSEWSVGAPEAKAIVIAKSASVHPIGDWTMDQLFLECRVVPSRPQTAGCKTPERYSKTVRGPLIFSRKTRALVKVPVPEGVNPGDISMARILEKSFLVTDGRGLWEVDTYAKATPLDALRPDRADFVAAISPTGNFIAFAHVADGDDSTLRGRLRAGGKELEPNAADRSFVAVVDRKSGTEVARLNGAPNCKFTPDEKRLICIHFGLKGTHATPVESVSLTDQDDAIRVNERYHDSMNNWAISADSDSFVVDTYSQVDVFDAKSLDPLHRIQVRSRAAHGLLTETKLVSVVNKTPQIRQLGGPSVDLQLVAQKATYDRREQNWRESGGERELLQTLAEHTKPRRDSKWVKRDAFEVDSRQLTVIPRPGVEAKDVLDAFDDADVEVVAVLELVGLVMVQTNVFFDDADSLMDAEKSLEESGLFETVTSEGRMEPGVMEGGTF